VRFSLLEVPEDLNQFFGQISRRQQTVFRGVLYIQDVPRSGTYFTPVARDGVLCDGLDAITEDFLLQHDVLDHPMGYGSGSVWREFFTLPLALQRKYQQLDSTNNNLDHSWFAALRICAKVFYREVCALGVTSAPKTVQEAIRDTLEGSPLERFDCLTPEVWREYQDNFEESKRIVESILCDPEQEALHPDLVSEFRGRLQDLYLSWVMGGMYLTWLRTQRWFSLHKTLLVEQKLTDLWEKICALTSSCGDEHEALQRVTITVKVDIEKYQMSYRFQCEETAETGFINGFSLKTWMSKHELGGVSETYVARNSQPIREHTRQRLFVVSQR